VTMLVTDNHVTSLHLLAHCVKARAGIARIRTASVSTSRICGKPAERRIPFAARRDFPRRPLVAQLNEEEQALFASKGIGVAHCPASNTRLASGIAPVR
jgi:hypothetical protein